MASQHLVAARWFGGQSLTIPLSLAYGLGRELIMAKPLVSDELWVGIEPLIPKHHSPTEKGGRPPVDDRAALAGILFVLKTGIPWEDLPQSAANLAAHVRAPNRFTATGHTTRNLPAASCGGWTSNHFWRSEARHTAVGWERCAT